MALKLLIVDDSDHVRLELSEVLTAAGYTVVQAVDGKDGLNQAMAHDDIALILTDFNMPGLDGLSMLAKIRELGGPKGAVPTVVLTTERTSELKSAGKALGVKAWIIKPFVASSLLKMVAVVLSQP